MGAITRSAVSDARRAGSDSSDLGGSPDPFLLSYSVSETWNLDADDLLTALQTVAVLVALAEAGRQSNGTT